MMGLHFRRVISMVTLGVYIPTLGFASMARRPMTRNQLSRANLHGISKTRSQAAMIKSRTTSDPELHEVYLKRAALEKRQSQIHKEASGETLRTKSGRAFSLGPEGKIYHHPRP